MDFNVWFMSETNLIRFFGLIRMYNIFNPKNNW